MALAFALGVLGVVIARLAGWNPDINVFSPAHPSPTLSGTTKTPLCTESFETAVPGTATPPRQSPTPGPTLVGPLTPADAWANSLLDKVLNTLQEPQSSPDGFAWWQSSEAGGELVLTNAVPALNQQLIDLDGQTRIDVSVVKQDNPNQLDRVASVIYVQGALTLTVFSRESGIENEYWVLSNAEPSIAFKALVVQATARASILEAAYMEKPASTAEFVLVGVRTLQIGEASPTEMSTPVMVSATYVPTWTIPAPTSTPTREPDIYLGRVIAAAIDPIIDNAAFFLPAIVQDFANRHPRTGYLTWSGAKPQIGGHSLSVDQAEELTFYTLTPSDAEGTVTSFLKVIYIDHTTRLPEKQIYFPGQRMEEILLWIVTRADERGGRLNIAYDDFGTKQAVTVIGFDSSEGSDN
ncbi:MAG: hypothetical protein JXB30_19425 [Anaerolineae bacterium]|nr:hypothetical protein [Anaerolineae bacterium]